MNEKIPKIIHYCWFGKKAKPKQVLDCISSWKKNCPEYQINEWNESNFDIQSFAFTREAYEMKKYAFVSDFVRLYALYSTGGIYLDTDVIVKKNFDDFLDENVFMSFESSKTVCTAVIGAKKGSNFIKNILSIYEQSNFIRNDGKLNERPNSEILFESLLNHQIDRTKKINVKGVTLYPVDYFCAKDYKTFDSLETDNTVSIHLLDATWYSPTKKIKRAIKKVLIKIGLDFLWR